jgi:hypothetical protein
MLSNVRGGAGEREEREKCHHKYYYVWRKGSMILKVVIVIANWILKQWPYLISFPGPLASPPF